MPITEWDRWLSQQKLKEKKQPRGVRLTLAEKEQMVQKEFWCAGPCRRLSVDVFRKDKPVPEGWKCRDCYRLSLR